MTPEKQRIAIATACGWSKVGNDSQLIGQRPGTPPVSSYAEPLPDYLNDLNAIAEAEKIFDVDIEDSNSLRYRYSHFLYKIVPKEQQPFRATAAQRAEALLKTIGLWEEE